MNTVIKINGLDVEFSDKVPTKPGAYYRVRDGGTIPEIEDVYATKTGRLVVHLYGVVAVDTCGGRWSTSPLVPAAEVQRAYFEGDRDCIRKSPFSDSRARRVTEGGE